MTYQEKAKIRGIDIFDSGIMVGTSVCVTLILAYGTQYRNTRDEVWMYARERWFRDRAHGSRSQGVGVVN